MSMISGSAAIANLAGIHARPVVKLTQAAKSFAATRIELALGPDGPWIDAKSPVRMMRLKAKKGEVLHVRADGPDAATAVAAVIELVDRKFDEE